MARSQYYWDNREKMMAYRKKYYADNKEAAQAYNKQWRIDNQERIKESGKKYWEAVGLEKLKKRRKTIRERKDILVASRGGKCEHCHQSYIYSGVYDFHHKDPTIKEFGIARGLINNKPMEDLLTEVDKCLMLCSNCHRIEHARLKGDLDEQGSST